ncbi:MAG: ATP-dependent sacrificial sulfur transferase LarE [Candidatus Krumholzibacteriota bacterium]|nr:ATP-dependent sacrificial sulfur transferase LarE [Candidatus Krumholzibacteriota bacterium]
MTSRNIQFPLDKKLAALEEIIRGYGRVVLALSGGVDSTYLLVVARELLGGNLLAVTVEASFMPAREIEEAKGLAGRYRVEHQVVAVDESEIEGFTANPPDRCYICKKFIFTRLLEIARERGYHWVMDATNRDDVANDYRPGIRALRELKIVSPLREAGLGKEEIRALSRERGLEGWDRAASACLASRIPYGQVINREKLEQVQEGELFLSGAGFTGCRVRHHGEVARIEVPPGRIRDLVEDRFRSKLVERFKSLGFRYVCVDAEGYRTGSLNESLDL